MKESGWVIHGDKAIKFCIGQYCLVIYEEIISFNFAKKTCSLMRGVIFMIKKIKEFIEDLIYFIKES